MDLTPGRGVRAWTRTLRAQGIAALARKTNLTREPLSRIFLKGQGIEVGALNWPLPVPSGSRSLNVDAHPTETLRKWFPDILPPDFRVDVVAPIETLDGIADESQDYAVANHVIEHSEDPIRCFETLLRVLKPDGILFFALPDKRFTFDAKRPVTPWDHVLRDYREGPSWSRMDHFREHLRLVEGLTDDAEVERRALDIAENGGDLHYHVWTQTEILEMLVRMRLELGFPLEVEAVSKTGLELIGVVRKRSN